MDFKHKNTTTRIHVEDLGKRCNLFSAVELEWLCAESSVCECTQGPWTYHTKGNSAWARTLMGLHELHVKNWERQEELNWLFIVSDYSGLEFDETI